MKLIDKDALVAEIERRIKEYQSTGDDYWFPVIENLKSILSTLDTIEVKEVDLEKYYHDFLQKEWFNKNCCRTVSEMMAFTAKHFFELGMAVNNKAQKGEEV